MGYWQDAQPFYNKALSRDNDIFDLHRKRGNYFATLQRWKEAEKEFDAMERLYPDVLTTYRVRGIARYYNRKYREAITDLDRYLATDSMHREAIAYRGRCYQELGQMWVAYRDLSVGREFDWIDFDRANNLMDSLIWKEDMIKLDQFVSIFKVFLPFPVRNFSAEVFEMKLLWVMKNWSRIEDEWTDFGSTKWVKEDKRFGSFLFTVHAAALIEKGKLEEAHQALTVALSYDKSNSYAYLERGKLFLQSSQMAKAREDFSNALRLGDIRAKKYLEKAE